MRQKDPAVTACRRLSLWTYQLVGAPGLRQPLRVAGAAPAAGLPGQPERATRSRASRRSSATSRSGRRRARTSTTRPTGSSSRSTRSRQQAELGFVVARPALGDRLQVPCRAGHHEARGDRGLRRAHRRADPGRARDAGVGRRDHGPQRDAPQHRRDPAQGPARRRHDRAAAGRRRDPGGRRPRSSTPATAPRPSGRCRRTARCAGRRRVREEGEVVRRCPNPWCPAQRIGGLLHFTGRGGMDIEGLGYDVVNQLAERELLRRSRPTSSAGRRDARGPGPIRPQERREPASPRSRRRATARWPASSTRSASATSASRRRSTSPTG